MNPTSKLSKLTRYLSIAALALAVQFAASPADAHNPDVSLSGFGTPTIDGVLSPGEWDSADAITFDVNIPPIDGGGVVPGTLFVMNDENNLYLAVEFPHTDPRNTAAFGFDNDHLGGSRVNGDDGVLFNPEQIVSFIDSVRSNVPPCPLGALCGFRDTTLGGTTDGDGAFSNAGGVTIYEFSHPLDSADDAHDFSLSSGDTVGFSLFLSLRPLEGGTTQTNWPSPSTLNTDNYGDIVIAFAPPTNQPPVAVCQDVTVSADSSCTADASIDAGSVDPDGDPITLSHNPASPYPLGITSPVTLTVTDDKAASTSCSATVTVVDNTPPAVNAVLVPVGEGDDDDDDSDEGRFRVEFSCADACAAISSATATLNGIAVVDGQVVELEIDDETEVEVEDGILEIEAPSFSLDVTCTDAFGNVGTAQATPTGLGADNDDDDDDDDD